jgi:taspase, threonine aspartase, 1
MQTRMPKGKIKINSKCADKDNNNLQGTSFIKEGKSALDAATEAVAFLEDSAITNAGFGSNLTWDGEVECDASAMDGTTRLWGAVGAAAGLKNPCRVAREICLRQQKLGTLGRVPPCLLVSSGANNWAKSNGLQTVDPIKLIHG